MNLLIVRPSLFVGILITFSTYSSGAIVAPRTMANLLPDSEAIVTAVILDGSAAGLNTSVQIRVDRVLKGDVSLGSVLNLIWTKPLSWPPAVPFDLASKRGLFFLSRKGAGAWQIVPAQTGNVDFSGTIYLLPPDQSRPQDFTASSPDDVAENILWELAWSIERGTFGAARTAGMDLVSCFRGLSSPGLTQAFVRLSKTASLRLNVVGMRVSIASGDPGTLLRMEKDQNALASQPDWRSVTDELRFRFASTDPTAVAILGRLVRSSGTLGELREASAYALSRVHTKEALPYLAELLESADLDLLTCAVGGLAMFANNIPIGSHHPAAGPWPFRTEETMMHSAMSPGVIASKRAYYVDFWKRWWAENRAALTR
jgi:hypothetical protein